MFRTEKRFGVWRPNCTGAWASAADGKVIIGTFSASSNYTDHNVILATWDNNKCASLVTLSLVSPPSACHAVSSLFPINAAAGICEMASRMIASVRNVLVNHPAHHRHAHRPVPRAPCLGGRALALQLSKNPPSHCPSGRTAIPERPFGSRTDH